MFCSISSTLMFVPAPLPRCASCFNVSVTCSTMTGASPSVGSSITSTRGLNSSARPIASICCSPPDNWAPPWRRRSASRGNKS
jgi:hypothetical protein